MTRLAAWCERGGSMFTAEDLRARVDGERHVIGYKCPACGRVLKASQWSDAARTANGDSRGWVGTSGMKWPRHYAWAQSTARSRPANDQFSGGPAGLSRTTGRP